jgi:hypothetical protein
MANFLGSWVNALEWIANAATSALMPQRPVVWFNPSHFTATDDEANGRTKIELGGSPFSNEDKAKLDGIAPGAATGRWTAPPTGLAASALATPYYEQIYANRTGSTVELAAIVAAVGATGIATDGTNNTQILVVRRLLDGTGSENTCATYTNATTALVALTDTTLTAGGISVADGRGLWIKISRTNTGTDIPGGVSVYLVF